MTEKDFALHVQKSHLYSDGQFNFYVAVCIFFSHCLDLLTPLTLASGNHAPFTVNRSARKHSIFCLFNTIKPKFTSIKRETRVNFDSTFITTTNNK